MIKVKDLRVGNYVHGIYKDFTGIKKIESEVVALNILDADDTIRDNVYIKSLKRINYGDDFDNNLLDIISFNKRINDVEPIDITEEILIKLGFSKQLEKTMMIEIYYDTYFFIKWHEDKGHNHYSFNLNLYAGEEYRYAGIELKYVHQLQNIFYALFNGELSYMDC